MTVHTPTVHMPTVRPGLNPGAMWVRLCTAHILLAQHPLNHDDVESWARIDGEMAGLTADLGTTVWCYVYDGDSGRCMATLITEGEP